MISFKSIPAIGLQVLAAVFAASVARAAPIVADGSFVNGATDWTVTTNYPSGGGVVFLNTLGQSNTTGYGDNVATYQGNSTAAYFVDDGAVESVSQHLTLLANTSYTLSFALFATLSGDANPNPFSIEESLTGLVSGSVDSVVVTQLAAGAWINEASTLTTGSDTDYVLDFVFTSGQGPAKDVILTDVAVAEPASLTLLALGVIGSVVMARRRRTA